jgi:RNA polymerase sigma-70 factor, ECF subfamily
VDGADIERLVEMARAGDAEAFGLLFDHYYRPVYRFIVLRVGRPADAEDLTQLVFLKALEALPRYETRGVPFAGWLFRLARNAVIDHIRTRRDHADLDTIADRPTTQRGPEDQAVLQAEIRAMGAALAELTDEQSEVVALRFFAGLSVREVAATMGKQEGTVRGLQFRAIAALRRRLDSDEPATVALPARADA